MLSVNQGNKYLGYLYIEEQFIQVCPSYGDELFPIDLNEPNVDVITKILEYLGYVEHE